MNGVRHKRLGLGWATVASRNGFTSSKTEFLGNSDTVEPALHVEDHLVR